MTGTVDTGREAFEDGRWSDALEALSSATNTVALSPPDLFRLAIAAYLTRVEDWDQWCALAYQQCLDTGDRVLAARCAFWLAFGLLDAGEGARGSGWMTRAEKALDADVDCAERGLLLIPQGLACLERGDTSEAFSLFEEMMQIGERFADPDVATIGCLGCGEALIARGDRAGGLARLDEAMVAVTAREVSAPVVGVVTCAAIIACLQIFDVARGREWTAALTRWCDAQPDLVPYRGQCLAHRAEILRVHGSWSDAAAAAQAACVQLAGAPAEGDARYERAEMHRLRGELVEAEEAYRAASRAGRDPQPGLALLRLAQGDVAAAAASIRRYLDVSDSPLVRARALGPLVEISLAAGDVAAARDAAEQLCAVADKLDAPYVHATAASLTGRVQLAEGDARTALVALRRAWRAWQEIGAPYEAALVRVQVGAACREVGDADGEAMELEAARWVFHELGAVGDLARLESAAPHVDPVGRLTPREVDVLRLVAAGMTNRAVSDELFISDKTVARHLSNIFTKLGVSSRSAATAWAYEHGLTGSTT